mmetsp:Transcript_152908/g.490551  ORF Transcript_152908/g.490551 Transcript_152908/m.490551 type:complete len:330 (-) Transcript_152908:283-1272(-)
MGRFRHERQAGSVARVLPLGIPAGGRGGGLGGGLRADAGAGPERVRSCWSSWRGARLARGAGGSLWRRRCHGQPVRPQTYFGCWRSGCWPSVAAAVDQRQRGRGAPADVAGMWCGRGEAAVPWVLVAVLRVLAGLGRRLHLGLVPGRTDGVADSEALLHGAGSTLGNSDLQLLAVGRPTPGGRPGRADGQEQVLDRERRALAVVRGRARTSRSLAPRLAPCARGLAVLGCLDDARAARLGGPVRDRRPRRGGHPVARRGLHRGRPAGTGVPHGRPRLGPRLGRCRPCTRPGAAAAAALLGSARRRIARGRGRHGLLEERLLGQRLVAGG